MLTSSGKRKKWQLKKDKLIDEEERLGACIISEELAYNKSLKQYRIFIIDRPLVEGPQRRSKPTAATKEDMLAPKQSLQDYLKLLECFAKHNQVGFDVAAGTV